ncbi:MAG: cell wall-active antibiotics response protein [Fibrobacter sp.]|nr:cell wall-active antibiotics response protein [Fibrobacter sp.]
MSTHHGGWSSFPRSFITGAIIIAIGLFLLAKSLGFIPYDIDLHHFWPLILIAVGTYKLIFPCSSNSYFWGPVLILTGAIFQANYLNLISVPIHKMWPLIPIIIGVKIMLRPFFKSDSKYHTAFVHCSSDDFMHNNSKATSDDTIAISLVLSGGNYSFSSQALKDGYISVSLGGCEIDFTRANFESDMITIDVNVLLGGIEIRIPETWSVSYVGNPVLGVFENNARTVPSPSKKLLIRGSITLAGIEVKN